MGDPDKNPEYWQVACLGRVVTEPILGFLMYLKTGNTTSMAMEYGEFGVSGKPNSWHCFQDLTKPDGSNKFSDNLENTQKYSIAQRRKIFCSVAWRFLLMHTVSS